MAKYPRAISETKNLVTCNYGGRDSKYPRVYLPQHLVIKYNLIGPCEVIEDEENHQLIIKKYNHKARPIGYD